MCLHLENKSYTSGFAFFPYGSGLFETNNDEMPENCIMIAGQDFGNINYIDRNSFQEHGDEKGPTMNNFKKLKIIENRNYFFTNVFMGLREEGKMLGINPALKNKITKMSISKHVSLFSKIKSNMSNQNQLLFLAKYHTISYAIASTSQDAELIPSLIISIKIKN